MPHRIGALAYGWLLVIAATALAAPPAAEDSASRAACDARSATTAIQRYPTSDEVFYVLSCMKLNGDDANGLRRCSCAVDTLEKTLSYDGYRDAEMAIQLRQADGRDAALLRGTDEIKDVVTNFVRAQQKANTQCFGALKPAKHGTATSKQ